MKKAVCCVLFAVFLCMTGCSSNVLESVSDDSSDAADIESARMELDDGNYQKAIDILEPEYDPSDPDPEVVRILASAYMGKAGVDLTYVLENSEESEGDSFDTIASALSLDLTSQPDRGSAGEAASSSARFVVFDSALELLENLEQAQAYLDDMVGFCTSGGLTPEQDDTVQLGMASAMHFIIAIGEAAAEVRNCNIPVNKYAYREIFPDEAGLDALLADLSAFIDDPANGILEVLREDLERVSDAVDVLNDVLGLEEDIAEEFDEFLTQLLGGEPIAGFSGDDLTGYISTELLGYN